MDLDIGQLASSAATALAGYRRRPPTWTPLPHQIPPSGAWGGWLLLAGRGAGKPLDVDTLIPTPTGWTTMGKLQIGDEILAHDGSPTRIIDAYDPGVTDAWRVTFDDGAEMVAGSGHLWSAIIGKHGQAAYRTERDLRCQYANWWQWRARDVNGSPIPPVIPAQPVVERARQLYVRGLSWRAIERVVLAEFPDARRMECSRARLKEMIVEGVERRSIVRPASTRHQTTTVDTLALAALRADNVSVWIPTTLPLQLQDCELPIDPYIFGAWLGDGYTGRGHLCAGAQDIAHLRSQFEARGYDVTNEYVDARTGAYSFKSNRLHAELRTLDLIGRKGTVPPHKYVPTVFTRASIDQRLELIRGLMDTDGFVESNGRGAGAGFVNENIADALYELVVSLGIIARRRIRWLAPTEHRPRRPFFYVNWRPTPELNPFNLPRKSNVVAPMPRAHASRKTIRRVLKVERVEDRQLRCIAIDAESRLFLAGRSMIPTHNTDACARYVVDHVNGPPCLSGPVPHIVGIIAPTLGDAVKACFVGPSGIRAHDSAARLVNGPGGLTVRWTNGGEARLFGAHTPDDVERLRAGGNNCLCWLEELAAWRHLDAAWDQMELGLRAGDRPHWVASTTPKPRPQIKKLARQTPRDVVLTRATTYDNPWLPVDFREKLEERYGGLAIGRQELNAEIMEDDENALWSSDVIDRNRVDEAPTGLRRVTVGVDPSGGAGEQGIVVGAKHVEFVIDAGRRADVVRGYVLADRSCKLTPDQWGRRAIEAAVEFEADDVVVETNFGGDMALSTLAGAADALGVSVPIRKITASRGKRPRAEPVAALAARDRWHHVGVFEQLEDQLRTWTPESGWSPDRLDAMVWTAWHNKIVTTTHAATAQFGGTAARRVIG